MLETMNHVESAEIKAVEQEHGVMPNPQDAARLGPENGTTSLTARENARVVTCEELAHLKSPKQLLELLQAKAIDIGKIKHRLKYAQELEKLQIELVKMQRWVQEKNKRVAIIFEGRDAAGKGGTIQRFTEHLNPRAMRVVALPVPTVEEQGQWYFQRYIKQLPNRGEIVFFDRSWYNRAVASSLCMASARRSTMNVSCGKYLSLNICSSKMGSP